MLDLYPALVFLITVMVIIAAKNKFVNSFGEINHTIGKIYLKIHTVLWKPGKRRRQGRGPAF
ncbi:MAG TPA: hypothetical protein VFQ30_19605, partial [Ktedonobacteraceae bacterium]|nr:hypothetical protein [Ktedonobacteraceae bacterium]